MPMKITRQSMVTGEFNTLELPITEEQYQAWQHGTLIQNAMPGLTADQREFLQTGTYPGEWETMMKKLGLSQEDA